MNGDMSYELIQILKSIRSELHIANLIAVNSQTGGGNIGPIVILLKEAEDGARAI